MARGKGGLGRGLESLFEDASPIFESDAKVETLPLREIEPDPDQPRKTFDQQALGELAALAGIPILAMTANAFDEDRRNALASGMNGFLSKPIMVGDLVQELRKIL